MAFVDMLLFQLLADVAVMLLLVLIVTVVVYCYLSPRDNATASRSRGAMEGTIIGVIHIILPCH